MSKSVFLDVKKYKAYVPFIRMSQPQKHKDLESSIKGRSFLPELLFIGVLIYSYSYLQQGFESVGNILIFAVWAVVLVLLFTLALNNKETFLLPDALVKPIGMAAIVFQILTAVETNNINVLFSALIGALIVGGIPYILFQVSAGKWIGGGDTKLGFVAGILLGWKLGLLCVGVMVSLVVLSFLVEFIVGKLSKTHVPSMIPTGVLWVTSIIISMLVGFI